VSHAFDKAATLPRDVGKELPIFCVTALIFENMAVMTFGSILAPFHTAV
jgi:hypothetical protein